MKRFAVSVVLLIGVVAVMYAQSDLQPLVNIKLNKSESITLKNLKTRVEAYEVQAALSGSKITLTAEQRKEVLDSMIDEKLIVQAATKAGYTVTDSQVNEYFMTNISSQVGQTLTEAQFIKLVEEQSSMGIDDYMKSQVGMSLADYKAYLKNQLITQQYILATNQEELAAISPTDAEVRSFYEMNKSSFVQNDILKLFLVVVPKGTDRDAANTKAVELYNDLKNKKQTFDQLKIKMKDASAGFQAGDMYISKTNQAAQQLGIDFTSLVDLFTNDAGFISTLNETDTDFQFYTIREKYSAKILALSDIVQPDTTVTVYEYIKTNLVQTKQQEYLVASVQKIADSLRTSENYQMLKSGDALTKLLSW